MIICTVDVGSLPNLTVNNAVPPDSVVLSLKIFIAKESSSCNDFNKVMEYFKCTHRILTEVRMYKSRGNHHYRCLALILLVNNSS